MTVEVQLPIQGVRYVDADGRLTLDGVLLLQRIVDALEEMEARLQALEP